MDLLSSLPKAAVTKFAFPGVPNQKDSNGHLHPASPDIRKLHRRDGHGFVEYVLITPVNGPGRLTIFTCQGRLRALDDKGVQRWRQEAEKHGVNIVLHNYPGYGDMAGGLRDRERRLKADCVELMDFLVGEESGIGGSEICLLGNSIGCGPTLWLAAQKKWGVKRVVVVSPYTSIWALGPYWALGQPLWLGDPGRLSYFHTAQYDPFPAQEMARSIQNMRILILHGDRDDVVPPEHGRQVFEFLKQQERKDVETTFVKVNGATHGDTRIIALEAIFMFFEGQEDDFKKAAKGLEIGKGSASTKEED